MDIAAFIPYPAPNGDVTPVLVVGWTLNYEMFFYLLFALAVFLPRIQAVVATAVVLTAGVIVNSYVTLPLPLSFWLQPIVLEFVFGMLIALAYRSGVRFSFEMRVVALLTAAILLVAAALYPDYATRLITFGIPCAVLVAAFALSKDLNASNPGWRALGIVGNASYSLYLLHSFALVLPRQFIPASILAQIPLVIYVPFLIALAILVALVSYYLIERPLSRLQPKLVAPKPVGPVPFVSDEAMLQGKSGASIQASPVNRAE